MGFRDAAKDLFLGGKRTVTVTIERGKTVDLHITDITDYNGTISGTYEQHNFSERSDLAKVLIALAEAKKAVEKAHVDFNRNRISESEYESIKDNFLALRALAKEVK